MGVIKSQTAGDQVQGLMKEEDRNQKQVSRILISLSITQLQTQAEDAAETH